MSEILEVPKKYLEKILKPVSRLTDSCVLNFQDDNVFTVCSSPDNFVVLYAKLKLPYIVKNAVKLNLISAKRFLTGLNCLGDDGKFEIKISENAMICQLVSEEGEKTHFKYHLVDDNIIKKCPMKAEKIMALSFDTDFVLSSTKIKQILQAFSFSSESVKIYFYEEDGTIYTEIDDKTKPNNDSIKIPITKTWNGEKITENFITNLDIFKNLMATKNDVSVKINNQYKVAVFDSNEEESVFLKYVISSLVK